MMSRLFEVTALYHVGRELDGTAKRHIRTFFGSKNKIHYYGQQSSLPNYHGACGTSEGKTWVNTSVIIKLDKPAASLVCFWYLV